MLEHEQQFEKYFEEHAVDGKLPQEEVAKLMSIAMSGDDTMTMTPDETPEAAEDRADAATMSETAEEAAKTETAAQPEPEPEPVIVAKDGRNTIPFSELADAREEAKNERSQREALERELAALKAKYEGEESEGGEDEEPDGKGDAAQDDALAKLREDWPEVAEPVEQALAAQQRRIDALTAQLTPMQAKAQEQMIADHFNAIQAAHPDAEQMVTSKEFTDWKNGQTSFVQAVCNAVLERGTAEQVIELFDDFKRSTGWGKEKPQVVASLDYADKQQEAVQKAQQAARKASTPKSLSDIPGGTAAPTDPVETIMQMGPESRIGKFFDMTPDRIEEMMRRAV